MYKAIIFDFFDVVHSDPFHAWMIRHNLRREGAQAQASRKLDRGDITMLQFYEQLSKVTGQTGAEVQAEFEASKQIDTAVIGMISELKRSFKIAVVSNAESDYIRDIIHEHNLAPLFEHIIVSAEVGFIKPNPEIFEHTLEKLDVTASEAIFIDDNPANVEAAENVGLTGIIFTGADALRKSLHSVGVPA